MTSGHRRRRSPGIGATFDERCEAKTLVPRAKQAPRRIPVRWYPTHGYQHERPSHLQAPSSPMARAAHIRITARNGTRAPTSQMGLDNGSHISALPMELVPPEETEGGGTSLIVPILLESIAA